MAKLVDRLASKGWLELTGSLTGMGVATSAALLDASKSATYDPALCATSGGAYCDQSLLPLALDLALVAFGTLILFLVLIAMGVKLRRRRGIL